MRWRRLFDDLEAQLDDQDRADLLAEVADRTRRERAQLGLHERLRGQPTGVAVTLEVAGAGVIGGEVVDVGSDWVLVGDEDHPDLVAFAAIRSARGLSGRIPTASAVARRFGLAGALRAVARDRRAVAVVDVDGRRWEGTIDQVGLDAFDLAEHPSDLPRRPENVIAVRLIPFWAVAVVRHR